MQPQATFMRPVVTGEQIAFLVLYHEYHNRNCMSITHSNFQILQLKFFAGVSLCRLVAIKTTSPTSMTSIEAVHLE